MQQNKQQTMRVSQRKSQLNLIYLFQNHCCYDMSGTGTVCLLSLTHSVLWWGVFATDGACSSCEGFVEQGTKGVYLSPKEPTEGLTSQNDKFCVHCGEWVVAHARAVEKLLCFFIFIYCCIMVNTIKKLKQPKTVLVLTAICQQQLKRQFVIT